MNDTSRKVGRDLDALIAEQVFGIKYEFIHGDYCIQDPEDAIAYLVCPAYSTNIAAAFQVEERMKELGISERYAYHLAESVISVTLFEFFERGANRHDLFAIAHATPEQRCRAALKAVVGGQSSSLYLSDDAP